MSIESTSQMGAIGLLPVLFGIVSACSTGPAGGGDNRDGVLALPVLVEGLLSETVLPGTQAMIKGEGFLDGAAIRVTVRRAELDESMGVELAVTRVDDLTLEVAFSEDAILQLGTGSMTMRTRVHVALGEGEGVAEAEQSIEVSQSLTPVASLLPAVAFPASPFAIRGAGFIERDEGATLAEIRGQFTRSRDGDVRDFEIKDINTARPSDTLGQRWTRDEVVFDFDPAWVGIEAGEITGELRVVNSGASWSLASDWVPVRFDLLPPIVNDVDPPAASRGEQIRLFGHGFIGGSRRGFTTIRIEGTFYPLYGEPTVFEGDRLEFTPVWISADELAFTFYVEFNDLCESSDIGATPGLMEGHITPITNWDGIEVFGTSRPIRFTVLPTKQVVWLRFLPAFTDSLRLFGLRNLSRLVQDHIVGVIVRDFTGINVEVRRTEPRDFLSYAVVEIGGPDPNAGQLFGLDNTPGFDRCNQRLNDNLAGRNADANGAFGGIFVESFLQLSARAGNDNPLASPIFDEIFDPVITQPVASGEYPGGPREAVIERAVRTLGALIGSTASHEIGHSLGLSVDPGCGPYHNAAGPGQLMDCGADRPFEERGEVNGQGPGVFTEANRTYMQRILPLPE